MTCRFANVTGVSRDCYAFIFSVKYLETIYHSTMFNVPIDVNIEKTAAVSDCGLTSSTHFSSLLLALFHCLTVDLFSLPFPLY
jgi:hypothetical protein